MIYTYKLAMWLKFKKECWVRQVSRQPEGLRQAWQHQTLQ